MQDAFETLTDLPLREVSAANQPLPLSLTQQSLWAWDQATSSLRHPTHDPLCLRLNGLLNVDALTSSLNLLMRRHSALSATFPIHDGQPWQVLDPGMRLSLSLLDLCPVSAELREERLQANLSAEVHAPFNLAAGPLVRASLFRLEEQAYVLLLNIHPIVCDLHAARLLLDELALLYNAATLSHTAALPPLLHTYNDYVEGQRAWLERSEQQARLSDYVQYIADIPLLLPLPIDHPRSGVPSFRAAQQRFSCGPELTQSLQTLSQKTGVAPLLILQAAWKILLYRYTRQEPLALGLPGTGRSDAALSGVVGCFSTIVVWQSLIRADQSFLDVLDQFSQELPDAQARQDLPIEHLVAARGGSIDPGTHPVVQVLCQIADVEANRLPSFDRLQISRLCLPADTAQMDLTIQMEIHAAELQGCLTYRADLFDPPTIERLGGHFQILLAALLAAPDSRVDRLPLLTDAERQQLVVEWNVTDSFYPRDICMHQLFEQQALRRPAALAVVCGQERLTYAQLNTRAARLAGSLRRQGVEPGKLVGLCIERSIEMVVCLLAILKAGGAYVPLSADDPRERLAFLVQDLDLHLVLTRQRYRAVLPAGPVPLVLLEEETGQEILEKSTLQPGSEDLAFVLYTSGSTGQPKGVGVTHRNVLHLVASHNVVQLTEQEVFLQMAPLNFDASTFEIWSSLLNGGRLVLFPPQIPSLAELGRVIEEEGVTTMWLTSGVFHQMIENQIERLRGVRQLVAGGDILSVTHVRKALHDLPQCKLINGYGPTENTTFTCMMLLSESCDLSRSVPIGKPIAQTQVYLLDPSRELVPIGVVGELYTGGDGVAVGYLKRPELTAERFLRDPFRDEPGARIYKTGDLARYQADGTLEFIGRLDQQVKIRGFRVEPGEIETALQQHPAVQQSLVLPREDIPGEKRLVAYVVVAENCQVDIQELRQFLQPRVPSYMLPTHMVVLDQIPLTTNGKPDRRKLPAPEEQRPTLQLSYVAPRTATEELLAGIWTQVLRLDRVGVLDNFFDLGGDSLLAMRIIARVRELFQIELSFASCFTTPTIAAMGTQVEVAQQTVTAGPEALALQKVAVLPEQVPLSFGQESLWLADRLTANLSTYNEAFGFRIGGVLNIEALASSLQQLVQRHQTLRTRFSTLDGQHWQVIAPTLELPLPLTDLQSVYSEQGDQGLRVYVQREIFIPFDLASGPLLRAHLFRLNKQEHFFLLILHHILTDGWSATVLFQELATFYTAQVEQRPAALPALSLQYADYALWQRTFMRDEVLERLRSYWLPQLQDAPFPLPLPTDHPRPPLPSYRGAVHHFSLASALNADLHRFSRQEGYTLFMILLAGVQTLLARCTNETDIVVGTPSANRTHPDLEPLIGYFVNMLALRTDLSGNPTVRELLSRVRDVALGAYAHQDLPFELLVQGLNPERDARYSTPLFQVSVQLRAPVPPLSLPQLRVDAWDLELANAKFDLDFSFEEDTQELRGTVIYNTDVFEARTIERLVVYLQQLFSGMVADPEQRLADLPLLTGQEQEQILVEWNDTHSDYPDWQCLHQLFEEQVQRSPENVAIISGEEQLTYRELNERANQLAHYLKKVGVGPEVLVCVCMDRSLDLMISWLGILKAGGAYVPLDPTSPQEYLAFMVEDTQAPVLLLHSSLQERFQAVSAQILCVDTAWPQLVQEDRTNPLNQGDQHNLAYVIYTSGSTGRPKGVLVEHQSLVNLAFWHLQAFAVQSQDRATHLAGIAFDAAGWELWPYLMVGASVSLVPDAVRLDPAQLQAWLIAQHITLSFLPTPVAEMVLALPWPATLALRTLLIGGDTMHSYPPAGLPFRVINNYGPTENTVVATSGEVLASAQRETLPSIGRPISNTQIYILDEALHPQPVGVSGELYIGGASVARGYLKRPELTAERFVRDPFRGEPGARLYKTGDLARYRADGTLEFVGRQDQQIKLRGFRVEAGEIEAAIQQHPAIQQSLVLLREDLPGEQRLVAYVVVAANSQVAIQELRQFLQTRLPAYMLPTHLVLLDQIPLTANGKPDRRRLPEPEEQRPMVQLSYVAPHTAVEELLIGIWTHLLRLDRVGVTDNFFDLGGDSLLAMRIIARVRELFHVELSFASWFTTPTIAALGQQIETLQQIVAAGPGSLALQKIAVRPARVPLSFGQESLWIAAQLTPGFALYNIPLVLHIQGKLDISILESSLNEIIRRHEIFSTIFVEVDEEATQVVRPTRPLALSLQAAGTLEKIEWEEYIARELQYPFDLERGPLLRAQVITLQEEEYILLLNLHHILFDGWSSMVLLQELAALYTAQIEQRPATLAPLPLQYADYALWQRAVLRDEVLERLFSYWLPRLRSAPFPLPLPIDHPRPPLPSYRGAIHHFSLGSALTAALHDFSHQESCTLFMVLLAGVQTLLARCTNGSDIVVGTPSSSRTHPDLEALIGYFVNMLVLRTDLSGNPTVRELLSRVREVALGAYAHQDLPFELLVQGLKPKRDARYSTPLVQVSVQLRSPVPQLILPQLRLDSWDPELAIAKFDLEITFEEDAQELRGTMIYNTDIFEARTIERLLACLRQLFNAIVADPEQRLSDLPSFD
jgi:amino acid adenylation domain-containing protein